MILSKTDLVLKKTYGRWPRLRLSRRYSPCHRRTSRLRGRTGRWTCT